MRAPEQSTDSNHPTMGDVIKECGFTAGYVNSHADLVFVVPSVTPKDPNGLLMSPVDPSDPNRQKCNFCGLPNTICKPDSHHAYWPKPPTDNKQAEKRSKIPSLANSVNYAQNNYLEQLRCAPQYGSPNICRKWHDTLHKVQSPPTIEDTLLPDESRIDIERSSEQFESASLLYALSSKKSDFSDREATARDLQQLERCYRNTPTPKEALFPYLGYYCMKESLTPEDQNQHLPYILDLDAIRHQGMIAIERCQGALKK